MLMRIDMKSQSLEFITYSKKKVRGPNKSKANTQSEMFSAAPNSVVVDAMISANNNMVKRSWLNS